MEMRRTIQRGVWKDSPDLAPENPTGADLARLVRRGYALRRFTPPSLPGGAARVLQLTANEDVDLGMVASIIEQDMLLSANILRLMQTPLYNRGVEITSISQAVNRLGLAALRHVVAEAALNTTVFAVQAYEQAMDQLRRHSAATAQIAQMVSRAMGIGHELAFLSGLFHDMGIAAAMLLIAEVYQGRLPELEAIWSEIIWLHERLNWHIMQRWDMPEGIREIVRFHHQLPEEARDPIGSAIICVADDLASECGLGHTPPELRPLLEDLTEGVTTEDVLLSANEQLRITRADREVLLEESELIVSQL